MTLNSILLCQMHRCCDLVIYYNRFCNVLPTFPVHFTNLEAQECYLPIARDAGTPFPRVPSHFNLCITRHFTTIFAVLLLRHVTSDVDCALV